ncbi:hypothetical protein V2J09_015279 [Rumex salicifolius]
MSMEAVDELGYTQLKDLKLEIQADKGPEFAVCFWVYLPVSTPFPSTILHQLDHESTQNVNFLVLNEEKKMMLLPLLSLQEESPIPNDSMSTDESPLVCSEDQFPLAKWVHICCEVSSNFVRIHMDGKIVGEKSMDSVLEKSPTLKSSSGVILAATFGDNEGLQGYVHDAKVLYLPVSVKDQHMKDPPLQLSIDYQSAYEIEEESDGVWGIVSGKASCRRKFALDVLVVDALGKPANEDLQVVASLVYNDNHAPVDKSEDGEDALLAYIDGIEYPAGSKPSKVLLGRASFKLKISQLSSKCDNRLFSVKFNVLEGGSYPFLETYSPPIRCISRSRNNKMFNNTLKKLSSGVHVVNGSSLPGNGDGHLKPHHNAVCEARASPPSKRVRLGQETTPLNNNPDLVLQRSNEECNSGVAETTKVHLSHTNGFGSEKENIEATENSASDTESFRARNSNINKPCMRGSLLDLTVFKYCLGSLSEKALMLKEIVSFSPDEDIERLAEQVSLYTRCYHHRHQILIAKRLFEEGEKAWNLISQRKNRLQWEDVVFEIEEQFMKNACCNTRSLTQQDFNFLRKISGCHDYMTQENFDKMWRWLYPIASTISKPEINELWSSTNPKWIEGFSTKEEVEYALQNPMVLQPAGTFILRFPTSRSWPHPDAGCLVVTYVSGGYNLNHRLLSSNYSSMKVARSTSLQELLLAEPELSRLKREPELCFIKKEVGKKTSQGDLPYMAYEERHRWPSGIAQDIKAERQTPYPEYEDLQN